LIELPINQIICGDCIEVMKEWPDNCIHAIVTDPPYGLEFMGEEWDKRKLKRNTQSQVVSWLGAGMRYNRDGAEMQKWHYLWATEAFRVLKPGGYMLAFGGTRTYHRLASAIEEAAFEIRDQIGWTYGTGFPKSLNLGKAIEAKTKDGSIEDAHKWEGWGTALKPAWEPICVARKPIEHTTVATVLKYGTGGLNIKGCTLSPTPDKPEGRWPANLIHDGSDEVLACFPCTKKGISPARFFYCAKASKKDRDAGLPDGIHNAHPTVKPTELMRYLVRLVTPPGGIVADIFAGSGSTGKACIREGFQFVCVEKDPEYCKIAQFRIAAAQEGIF